MNFRMSAEFPGTTAIWWGDSDAPYYDPAAHRSSVYFHTALRYFECVYLQSLSIDMPFRAPASGYYETLHTLADHNIGTVPFVVVIADGKVLDPLFFVQKNVYAWRKLLPEVTETGLSLVEAGQPIDPFNGTQYNLPAVTVDVTVAAFMPSDNATPVKAAYIRPTTGEFSIGRLDVAGTRFIRVAGHDLVGYLPKPGPTIDLKYMGLRIVQPDGAVYDYYTYVEDTPPFAGPGSYGVAL